MGIKNVVADFKQEQEEKEAQVRETVIEGNTRSKDWYEGMWHNTSAGHNKFYEIKKLPDGTVQLRWGRIGASGQTKIVSTSKAIEQMEKREGKGYYKVD